MVDSRGPRPITVTQVVGVMALAVIVFFIGAFASKAIRTYRLRVWRDELKVEIAEMELDRQNLLLEIERRQSLAWIDEALKETGQVPPEVLAVRLVPSEGTVAAVDAPSILEQTGASLSDRMHDLSYFDNPNWRAWMQLLLNRD